MNTIVCFWQSLAHGPQAQNTPIRVTHMLYTRTHWLHYRQNSLHTDRPTHRATFPIWQNGSTGGIPFNYSIQPIHTRPSSTNTFNRLHSFRGWHNTINIGPLQIQTHSTNHKTRNTTNQHFRKQMENQH